MSSTLIELPPEMAETDETSTVEYVEANSVEDFAHQTHISDEEVLSRVLLPGREFGPYRILGFIASGGMGEIYAAERLADSDRRRHPVALKVISPEHAHDWRIVERFKREASISKAIRSPHVIRVYEFGESDDGKAFLSMELLAGEELFERLCRVSTIPLDELADIALQVLSGLGDIHRTGFIHRDMKPENIFLSRQPDETEVAKILDFGIAKRRDERSDPLLSVAGQIYGTPEYLAPEQAINPDVDPRADIYSLGVMLYEAASGSLPFTGETSYAVIAAHQNQPVPVLPSSVDPEFAEIVYTALAKNPIDRFQTADEMAQILGRWRDATSWVEELPGGSNLGFEDVFDSQDLTPDRSDTTVRSSTRVSERSATSHYEAPEERGPVGLSELSDPKFYLGDDAPEADFEKVSVSKAKERQQRKNQQRKNQQRKNQQAKRQSRHKGPSEANEATGEVERSVKKARRPADNRRAEKQSQRRHPAPQQRTDEVDEPTANLARKDVSLDAGVGGGSRVAQIVTWITVAIIIAAIVWTFYPA